MFDKVNLKKLVSTKNEFQSVVDTQFRTYTDGFLGATPVQSSITIEQLFENYENLYFEIPITGPVNSHEYLVKKSKELVGDSKELEQLSMLIQQVDSLRNELAQAYKKIEELQSR